ncbi:hypothetical protein WL34_01710 [Burkholderia cepacia]|nr:hypothetical protein WL34_01710 [Burkholderia cepacia]
MTPFQNVHIDLIGETQGCLVVRTAFIVVYCRIKFIRTEISSYANLFLRSIPPHCGYAIRKCTRSFVRKIVSLSKQFVHKELL